MSLGTNKQWFMSGNGTNPFLSIGQSTKSQVYFLISSVSGSRIYLGYVINLIHQDQEYLL